MRIYLDASPIIYLVEQVAPYAVSILARLSAAGVVVVSSDLSRMEASVKPLRHSDVALLQNFESFFGARVAWSAGVDEIVTAMTPCMRLYAWLGAELASQLYDDHPYGDWIRTYADPEFETLARRLEVLLDDNAIDTPTIRSVYRYAMICERDFFAASMVSA
jgi:thiaminase